MELPDIKDKDVVIIGTPSSGKTYLLNLIKDDSHVIIHTDDYIKYGKDAINKIMEDIGDNKYIIEGMLGYKLLKKGVQNNNLYPDIVFEISIDYEEARQIYIKERNISKFKKIPGYMAIHNKILREYKNLDNINPPIWIKLEHKKF